MSTSEPPIRASPSAPSQPYGIAPAGSSTSARTACRNSISASRSIITGAPIRTRSASPRISRSSVRVRAGCAEPDDPGPGRLEDPLPVVEGRGMLVGHLEPPVAGHQEAVAGREPQGRFAVRPQHAGAGEHRADLDVLVGVEAQPPMAGGLDP